MTVLFRHIGIKPLIGKGFRNRLIDDDVATHVHLNLMGAPQVYTFEKRRQISGNYLILE